MGWAMVRKELRELLPVARPERRRWATSWSGGRASGHLALRALVLRRVAGGGVLHHAGAYGACSPWRWRCGRLG